MKVSSALYTLCAALLVFGTSSCGQKESQPRADHVIFIGVDAMSAIGLQRAYTPYFNKMIENGAVSVHTRCVRETSSSQNWMSMVSGAPIEIHGVFSNKWNPGTPGNLPAALQNKIGLYPTLFDHIRAQKPDYKQYCYIEWTGETRMYDMDVFDKACVRGVTPGIEDYHDVFNAAFNDYLQDRPEFMFLSVDLVDHAGHTYGHESQEYFDTITEVDSLVGRFVNTLEEKGWMENTVIIITADHGGIAYGHGGDTLAEFEIPIILYGKGVTKGKLMKHVSMIYDTGATAAALLGVELPWECRGKFLYEAFEPSDGSVYVPVPLAHPFHGAIDEGIKLTVDDPYAKIYYTLDGSTPDENSTPYGCPIHVTKAAHLRSVAYKNGCASVVADNYFYPEGQLAPIAYKLYYNVMEESMPDFTKFGRADAQGYCNHFQLSEFDVNEMDHFAILFTSNFLAEKDGTYSFEIVVDDWARLYIDGELIVTAHSVSHPTFGKVDLKAGSHKIKLEYYEHSKTQCLEMKYSVDGGPVWPLFPTVLER